jgi:hypothetical protein
VRLNRDHPNRAKFEPDQGFDPNIDLALVGVDWQIKVQGLASNWQDNLVVTSNRTGEQDALTIIEVLLPFLAPFLEHIFLIAKNGNYHDPVSLSTHLSNFIRDNLRNSSYSVNTGVEL